MLLTSDEKETDTENCETKQFLARKLVTSQSWSKEASSPRSAKLLHGVLPGEVNREYPTLKLESFSPFQKTKLLGPPMSATRIGRYDKYQRDLQQSLQSVRNPISEQNKS